MHSIEYIFHECNLDNKTLEIELINPIKIGNSFINHIIVLKVNCTQNAYEDFFRRYFAGVRTYYGTYSVSNSDEMGDPLNTYEINLDLNNIKEVWGRK